jgi:hypothetical protein
MKFGFNSLAGWFQRHGGFFRPDHDPPMGCSFRVE